MSKDQFVFGGPSGSGVLRGPLAGILAGLNLFSLREEEYRVVGWLDILD